MTEDQAVQQETANDRFKKGFSAWFWLALIVATVLHTGFFLASPTFGTDDFSHGPDELESVDLPDEIEIPPPPEAVVRPATPVIAETNIEDDLTIPLTTLDENPIENLPPPPSGAGEGDLAETPVFTPMTVKPQYRNMREIQRALMRHYPRALRDAGIGGTVNVWFFIDENGRVQKTQINRSSGYDAFDQAALEVADVAEFTPAYNLDKKVPVWIALDITFEVQ